MMNDSATFTPTSPVILSFMGEEPKILTDRNRMILNQEHRKKDVLAKLIRLQQCGKLKHTEITENKCSDYQTER